MILFVKISYTDIKSKFPDIVMVAHNYGIDYVAIVLDPDDSNLVEYIVVDYPEEIIETLDDEGFEDSISELLGGPISIGSIFSLPAGALLDYAPRSEVVLDDTNLRR